jgi:hypothetical protein
MLAWLDAEEKDRPGSPLRLEWMLRLVACEIARVSPTMWGGKPGDINPADPRFALVWKDGDGSGRRELSAEEKVAANPELYDAPPIMTKDSIARARELMRVANVRRASEAARKARAEQERIRAHRPKLGKNRPKIAEE